MISRNSWFAVLALTVPFLGWTLLASQSTTKSWGFDLSGLKQDCEPCKDFYQYVNGSWMERNPIPAAFPRWGRFMELGEKNRDTLRQILEEAGKNASAQKGSSEQKIGTYYATCMDENTIESEGLKPLETELARIERIKNLGELQDTVAHLQGMGVNVLFGFSSVEDLKDASQMMADAAQGGMGLPERDYYFKDDPRMKSIRDAYVKHISKMFELMGDPPATQAAASQIVMRIETALAENAMTAVELRDPNPQYNKMRLPELKSLTPHFSWEAYFKSVGLPRLQETNISQPKFFKALDQNLSSVPLSDWKLYMRWRLISAAAPALPQKFVEENFSFTGRVLTGTKELLPRWKRCVAQTNAALGEAVGQVFVQKVFPPEAKKQALEMIGNLRKVLRDNLSQMEWMSEATRKQAVAKLSTVIEKIGYPEHWRDYSALEITTGAYFKNRSKATQFEFGRKLGKVGKPTDRSEWHMTPSIVNAYYSPTTNEITFPAGILQPPFFDPKADDAVNYGAIGAVIGHELIHGFDDQGSKFDAHGNLKNWWTPEDRQSFGARASCVEKQYSEFKVEDNLYTNGKLVLGEAIADLGGLSVAYAAYQKSLEGKPRPQDMNGFSAEQRFFLGFAQVWGSKDRPELARTLTASDPHPLPQFRVNGTVANMPEFAKAFRCKDNDAMVRSGGNRCKIW